MTLQFTLPVNDILSEEITKINYTLVPPSYFHEQNASSVRLVQESLSKMIDTLGHQSASAQGLNKVITTGDKLRTQPTHILYLMKDASAKGGKGDVIGHLKVGRKHLFLFDEKNKVCEVEPLCVLDFYVVTDRQRHGYGKILFDHMLKDNNTTAIELAIDGASPKMEQFLKKNYGIDRLMRQNNNFAVAPEFFNTVANMNKSGRSTPVIAPAVGRFAAHKPPSAIASIIHGGSTEQHTTNGRATNGASPEPPKPEPELQVPVEPEVPQPEPEEAPEEVEEEKISPERPSTLSVEPISESNVGAPSPAGSTLSRRDSQLTDRGYFDVKFYHNKIW